MNGWSVRLLAALFAALLVITGAAGAERTEEKRDALRLHVIANSDTDEDQLIKLKVRDAVLECMAGFEGAESRNEAKTALLARGEALQEAADAVLRAEGAAYRAQLSFGRFAFPDRSYAGEVYPAGEYEALRITLGRGEGKNWWCVMFPPLCVIDCGEPASFYPDGRLEFKSILAELWRGIFG